MTHRLIQGLGLTVLMLGGLISSGYSATQTIATFSDPVAQPPPFLFQYLDSTNNATVDGVLSGGYSGTGLTLIFPFLGFEAHPDSTFTLTDSVASPVVGDPEGTRFLPVSPIGLLTFSDSSGVIMTATWNQLHRTSGVAGASDLTALEFVTLNVTGAGAIADPETFFFSFANVTGDVAAALAGNASIVQSTAAFTSSGTVGAEVPEPTSLLLIGTGLLGAVLLGKRRFSSLSPSVPTV